MTDRDRAPARRRWCVAAACAALVLVGCKGGNTDVKASGTTAPSTSTSAPPTTIDQTKVGRAQAAILQPADFPPGWGTQPEDAGLNIETVWRDITSCVGVRQLAGGSALATSPTFLQGLATQVRSTVEYTSEASASAYAAALASPKFDKCAADAFAADLDRSKPEGSTAGPVSVTRRDYAQFGQKTLAWRINATVNLSDLQVPLFQDFLVVFNGGTVVRLFFLNPGSEFPQNLERSLVERVVSRA